MVATWSRKVASPVGSPANIRVQVGYWPRLLAPVVHLNDLFVGRQQELQMVPYSCSHCGGEARLMAYVLGTRVALVLSFL